MLGAERAFHGQEYGPNIDYKEQEHQFEKDFLFSPEPLSLDDVISRTNQLREVRKISGTEDREGKNGLLDFYEASGFHERANDGEFDFIHFLQSEAALIPRQMHTLTREEFDAIWAKYPEKKSITQSEEAALKLYGGATDNYWKSEYYLNTHDARANRNDLAYRQAIRTTSPQKRDQEETRLLGELKEIAGAIDDVGKRAEYQFIYLVRNWARGQKIDHLVEIEHALPREDMKNKTDLMLRLGEKVFAIQLKNLSDSSYLEEHSTRITTKAAHALEGTDTALIVVPSQVLHETFKLEASDEYTDKRKIWRRQRELLAPIIAAFADEDARKYLEMLMGKGGETTEAAPKKPRITKNAIEKVVNTALLASLGLLSPEDRSNIAKIAATKNKLAEKAPTLISNIDELKQPTPELIEKIKQAMLS